MTRHAISTPGAPAAIGPYSQAIAGRRLRLLLGPAGTRPGDRRAGRWRRGPGRAGAAQPRGGPRRRPGCRFANVVKTTIFLADIGDFAAVNAVYAASCPIRHRPARPSPSGPCRRAAWIEIEAIAHRG